MIICASSYEDKRIRHGGVRWDLLEFIFNLLKKMISPLGFVSDVWANFFGRLYSFMKGEQGIRSISFYISSILNTLEYTIYIITLQTAPYRWC
jgi:hypothetical protein